MGDVTVSGDLVMAVYNSLVAMAFQPPGSLQASCPEEVNAAVTAGAALFVEMARIRTSPDQWRRVEQVVTQIRMKEFGSADA